ncbi:tail-component protein [Paracoccus phage vB_PthS_Pthi1]|uniref:Phage protein, HK97 gp10 family n=1 Tax=Paracoccus thiocyanatus TaxID=34006 RepID=A0A1N6SFL9_9RHOB|nr:HK97-gp10 family putative phage morphogenesis protein [Paracoccus thiocyanatus]AZV00398.1 tail-component protein [Paracoccus phage vB_PthS_Pthi1]SIQ39772.1 phage protein, HK97 gp10 family [Paracoccus thiocyanatus]
MAKHVTFKLEGFKELEATLMRLDKQATRKTVSRNALKKAGEPIKAAMEAHAPVDDGVLKGSITISTKIKGEVGKAAYSQAMRQGFDKASAVKAMRDARRAAKGTAPPVIMYVGPGERAFHAHLVEFGTAPHIVGGKFAGARHPGTAPQPFARPVWDANKGAALRILAEELRLQINKAIARQAKRQAKG